MKDFVKALYVDLIHRIDVVVLDITKSIHHPDIKDRFISDTLKQFSDIRLVMQNALDSGILEFETANGNNITLYNQVLREFNAIHSYRYLAIKNYRDPEVFFFRLIKRIYDEHRINATPPIVSTISNHDTYYWAEPYFEIIALPAGEESSLLNLPDMYHEIGHLLHSMFQGKSCELSTEIIRKHFIKEMVRIEDDGLGAHYLELLKEAQDYWMTAWIEEFTCDLVGTYMTGAAYAWTNLKLLSTAHGSGRIFEYFDSHPANEARMTIVLMMMEKLGLTAEKKKVEAAWKVFLKDTDGFKPKEYTMLFPKKLLQQLVDEFYEFYQNADLASYPEVLAKAGSVSEILNIAWDKAQADPMAYNQHETAVFEQLKKDFKLPEEKTKG
ncbi:hypothetical protein [Mucilaginibacter flavidus]|uniref:hypothetical protein n=1 Tax=Mucilaginibacter flavidus TaxID=2949309 RepID=UPI002092DA40|nr:hypothetical protein [Mucilaginibacter flavidus]MCO5950530.1 hypothetical protein [Mucilaginibacter flavidus]